MLNIICRCNVAKVCMLNARTIVNNSSKESKSIAKDLLENAATFTDSKPTHPDDTWATLPYVEGTVFPKRVSEQISQRNKLSPEETSIILFHDEGKQHVGMIKNLVQSPDVKDLFEIANDVLKYDLLKLCLEGPQEQLNQTIYGQPAVFVTSIAMLARLKEERPNAISNCVATAGFSLGEITALVFAGALPFDQALKLVQIRAEAMQMASELNPGSMAMIKCTPNSSLKLACSEAKEFCITQGIENPECSVAKYLFPSRKVIAGHAEALNFLKEHKDKFRLRSVKILPREYGPIHTNLMKPVMEPFTKALRAIDIKEPIIPVHSNIDGQRYRNAQHILKQLPKQIINPVKWEQTLHIMYERTDGDTFPRTFSCGPGSDLMWLLKCVNAKAWDAAIKMQL